MKTANDSRSGVRAADATRGRVSPTRASSTGMVIADADGNEVGPSQKALITGAIVTGDEDTAFITISGTGQQATNGSGATVSYGDVVVLQADGSITTTTTAQDTRPVGVVQIGAADGATAAVVFSGFVNQVNCTAAVTAGNYGETSTTAGKATENTTLRTGSFCQFLGSSASPAAYLFGSPKTSSAGSGLPWFNVVDYGAIGDGTTDDTAAINLAIGALIAAGGGVLYFPAGTFKCTSALTTLSVQCTVLGDGGSGDAGHVYATPATEVIQTSATANLFTVSANGCAFRGLALSNSAATPSAGAGIQITHGYFTRIEHVTISSFYDNLAIDDGGGWSLTDCFFHDPIRWGLRVQGTISPDNGDQSISGCYFMAETRNGAAAIRYESAGGLKIVNTKINDRGTGQHFVQGIDLAIPTGIDTGILLVANSSIENVSGDGIHGTTSAATSRFGNVIVIGCEFGLYGNNTGKTISLVGTTASDFTEVIVADCVFITNGTGRTAMQFTKCDSVIISNITLLGFTATHTATSSTNVHDRSGGIAAGVDITGTPNSGDVPIASSGTAAAWGPPAAGVSYATPAIVLGTAAAAGAASTVIRSDSTIVAFDATAPVTQALGDTAATGSQAFAARRDHKHGMPALSTATPLVESGAGSAGTGTASSREDHVHPAVSAGAAHYLVIASSHSTPLVFDNIVQTSAGDDFIYTS